MHRRPIFYLAAITASVLLLAVLLLPDALLRGLAATTLILAGCTSLLSALLGLPLAIVLFRTNMPGRRFCVVLLSLLLIVPLFLQAAAWIAVFGTQGWLGASLSAGVLAGMPATIWIHTAASIPWMVLITGLGLLRVEAELEEVALLDASTFTVLGRVTLPRAVAAVGVGMLWVGVTTAGEMTVTNLFQVRTFAEEIYTQFALEADADQAFTASLPGALTTALLIAGGLLVILCLAPTTFTPSARPVRPLLLGNARWPTALAAWLAVALLTLLPLASLGYKAGLMLSREAGMWNSHWSLLKMCSIVASSLLRFRDEFGWSLLIGSLAATLTLICAAPLAWQARRSLGRAIPMMIVIAVCFALPGPLVGIGLIQLFNRPDVPLVGYLYDNTVLPTVMGQAVRAFPVVALICWHAFQAVPRDLIDVAATEGAGGWALFTRVALPIGKTSIAAAWLIGLALALGELPASLLVAPPGVDLLSVRIFNLIHYGVDDQVAGISLVLCIAYAAIALLAAAALKVRVARRD